jgi:uncharacterized protein YcfL
MKKSLIVISVTALMLSACSGNQRNEHGHSHDTHTHDDGTVHQNHDAEEPKQEEFSVSDDTLSKSNQPETEHTHDGHEHPHKH